MTISSRAYLPALVEIMDGGIDFDTDTIKVALLTDSYTPDMNNDEFFSEISTYELASGNGYTSGGETLANAIITGNTGDGRAEVAYDDVEWTFTATKVFRYVVIYKSTGTDSTSHLIGRIDMGATRNESAGFYMKIPSTGLFYLRALTTSG